MFSFSRYCQTVFQSGCTKLYSHRSGMRVPVAPHPVVIGGVSLLITHSGGCVVVSCCFYFNLPYLLVLI